MIEYFQMISLGAFSILMTLVIVCFAVTLVAALGLGVVHAYRIFKIQYKVALQGTNHEFLVRAEPPERKKDFDVKPVSVFLWIIVTVVVLASLFIISRSHADIYDVNKTWNGDSNMCWAASAANILAYEGWATSTYPDSQTIFNDFKANFANVPGMPQTAISFYLGQNFPTVNPNSVMESNYSVPNIVPAIDQYLSEGYGVSAFITRLGGGAHAVTVWDDVTVNGVRKLVITDSDDGYNGQWGWPVYWDATDNWWEFNMYFGLAYLSGAVALDPYSDVVAAPIHFPVSGPLCPTPEAGTLWMLVIGLVGVGAWARRRRVQGHWHTEEEWRTIQTERRRHERCED